MEADAIGALATVAQQVPVADGVVPDEDDKSFEDIDSTFYPEGRPASRWSKTAIDPTH